MRLEFQTEQNHAFEVRLPSLDGIEPACIAGHTISQRPLNGLKDPHQIDHLDGLFLDVVKQT
jgi:hypothetical protein